MLEEKREKKEEVRVTTPEKPVQRINSVPGKNPAQLTLVINSNTLVFVVDSGARDNFCSTRT